MSASLLYRCGIPGLLLCALSTSATEVYVTRDSNGNLIFSDQPSQDAETHQVSELPTMPAFEAPAPAPQPSQAADSAQSYYRHIKILSPDNNANIPAGLANELILTADPLPPLRPGDTLELLSNGQLIRMGKDHEFRIGDLERGAHQLELVIRDASGTELIRSAPRTIYIQRHSILHPKDGTEHQK